MCKRYPTGVGGDPFPYELGIKHMTVTMQPNHKCNKCGEVKIADMFTKSGISKHRCRSCEQVRNKTLKDRRERYEDSPNNLH